MGGITLEDFTQSVAYREIFVLGEARKGGGMAGNQSWRRPCWKRQGGGDEGPLHQPLPIGQEAIDQPLEARCGGMKRRLQGIAGHLLQL